LSTITGKSGGGTDNVSDYIFDSILLFSERLSNTLDIKPIVTDLEIYEHLELPYLTGSMVIAENVGFTDGVGFLGGERIQVSLRNTSIGNKSIKKMFYVEKIKATVRNDDHTEVNNIGLVEDLYYMANLQNVNKYYSGSGTSIIQNIAKNFLGGTDISAKDVVEDESMNLIVPNLDPLHAMMWIKNKMTTTQGYPFYLFSTLSSQRTLALFDLGDLLQRNVINRIPYRGFQNASLSLSSGISSSVLNAFQFTESENLLKLIRHGLYGSEYQFYNTLSNEKNKFTFDVIKDLIIPLMGSEVLRNNPEPIVTDQYELDGTPFNQFKSRSITRIGGSGAYRTADQYNLSYDENRLLSDYKRFIISKAMSEILQKESITFAVDGTDFLKGDDHLTIGNNLEIEFLTSLVDAQENRIDTRRSGSYLIYAAKHVFKREKYDLIMSGFKMGQTKRTKK
jgi:hypothetical protein